MKKIILIASLAAITLPNYTADMQNEDEGEIKGYDRLNEYIRKNPEKISVEVLKEVMKSKATQRFVDKHGETYDFKKTQRLMQKLEKHRK